MMSMDDPIATGVKTLRIDNGCSLEKEFTELLHINPLIVIIRNCPSDLFMSRLCMWSFDLRHHLSCGWMIVF